MSRFFCCLFLICSFASCVSQNNKEISDKHVGGPCEGCEAVYEYGDRVLSAVDTLPDFEISSPQLKLSGTVFQQDGKTPAPDVIIYIYHTDQKGLYTKREPSEGWAKRHGYLRGWVKTDAKGKYTFYTFPPAPYPGDAEPEHIHMTVKEPGKNEYYIDVVVFEGDPLLTDEEKGKLENRGGSGIVKVKLEHGIGVAKRDIILGMNIPGY